MRKNAPKGIFSILSIIPYFRKESYTFKETFGEISMDEKNKISHRGKAIVRMVEEFQKMGYYKK